MSYLQAHGIYITLSHLLSVKLKFRVETVTLFFSLPVRIMNYFGPLQLVMVQNAGLEWLLIPCLPFGQFSHLAVNTVVLLLAKKRKGTTDEKTRDG